jgi:hypothetical protein
VGVRKHILENTFHVRENTFYREHILKLSSDAVIFECERFGVQGLGFRV